MVIAEIYHIDTRQQSNFHQSPTNFTKYQKGVYCLGIKVFNMLPSYIKIGPGNPLQKSVYENSFYSLYECLAYKIYIHFYVYFIL